MLIDILLKIISPITDYILKSAFRIKMALAALLIGAVVWWVWGLISSYHSMEQELSQKKIELQSLYTANESLGKIVGNLTKAVAQQKKSYEDSKKRESDLRDTYTKIQGDYTRASAVFDKECGRLKRLQAKKSSLITIKANRATNKLGEEINALIHP